MTDTHDAGLDVGHPAPQRHKVKPVPLLFALLGAPAAWMAQLLFAFASTSYVCFSGAPGEVPGWLGPIIIALNLLGLAVAVTALLVGLHLQRQTTHEHRERSGGIIDAGEGRTRFLALWGVFVSAAFIVATLANTLSLFLVPLCKS